MRNSHGGIMMTIEFNKCETSIRLHPDFDNITIALEQGDQIGLTDIRDQVADIDCCIEFWSLGGDDVI